MRCFTAAAPRRTAVRPRAAVAAPPAPAPPTTTPTWADLKTRLTASAAGPTYTVAAATLNAPGSSPVPTVRAPDDAGEAPPTTDKLLLLVRDTNSWCPFAQRVFFYLHARFGEGAADVYDTAFVNLRQKPAWHLKHAAANGAKVPAVWIGGRCVVESLDIMRDLEADARLAAIAPPLDAGNDAAAVADGLKLADTLSTAGYALARAAAPPPPPGSPYAALPPPPPLPEARAAFEGALAEFTALLRRTRGPFVGGGAAPSTADVALAPHFERLAANLPHTAGAGVDPASFSPAIAAWVDALMGVAAYRFTRGDAGTHRVMSKRLFGGALSDPPYVPADPAAAAEAAAKLVANADAVVADAVKNCGVPLDAAAVDAGVRRVAATLVTGHPGPAAADDDAANAAAAIVAAFLASRVSAPRDMSGSAAAELRAACARAGAAAFTGL